MTQLQGFVIRKAKPEDLQYVEQINLQTLPENYPEYFFREIYERYSEAFFVAETEGKIVGYCMCRVESGVSNFGLRWIRRGHIVSVSVLSPHRRKGLGTQLVQQSLEALKTKYNAKEVILEVRITNKPAICLYESLGFSRVRTLKAYYRNGDDAILMVVNAQT